MTKLSRTWRTFWPTVLSAAIVMWTGAVAPAQTAQEPQSPATAGAAPKADPGKGEAKEGLTVAVLDFSADTPEGAALGKQISEIVSASLGTVDGFKVIDRSALADLLKEQELNLTGLV